MFEILRQFRIQKEIPAKKMANILGLETEAAY